MRILVIDDDASVLKLIDQVLRSAGHETILVADPSELDGLNPPVDAGIIDWHLGTETCEPTLERVHSTFPELPFMVITGDTDLDLIQRALDLGAVGWWFKDTGPENLRRQILDLTGTAELRKSA